MRIADTTLVDLLSSQLASQQQSIATLDGEVASGLAIQQPSDNPIGTVDALAYQRQLAQLGAFATTAKTASSWLGLANSSVNTVLSTLQTVRSTILQALNSGAQTTQSYAAFANQLQGVLQTLVGLANTTYAGNSIFAGTASVPAAYSATGTYNGNQTAFTMQVAPGTTVAVGVPGESIFGGGASGVQDLFTTVSTTIKDLAGGPSATASANLQTDLAALDANVSLAENAATTLGESAKTVGTGQTTDQSSTTTIQTALANTMDANLATLGPELQAQITSYQAAVAAVSQVLPLTLSTYVK